MQKLWEENPPIGIDLGLNYSAVGVWLLAKNRVEIFENEYGNRTTPSVVAFMSRNQRLVGEGAKNQAFKNPSNTIFESQKLIGRRFSDATVQEDIKLWPFKVVPGRDDRPMVEVCDGRFSAEEISSMILQKMKQIAEVKLGKQVKDAFIIVPAYFNDSQRQATKDAGEIAGLNVLLIISEPIAAGAMVYDSKINMQISDGINSVLVFDLGGRTLDVSLVSLSMDIFDVKAIARETHLGEEDFVNRLVSHFVAEFQKKHRKDISGNTRALGRLRVACEKANKTLSSVVVATINIDCLFEGIDFVSTMTRAQFENMNMDLFKKCMDVVDNCLEHAKMKRSDINNVVLLSRSTGIPKFQIMLHDLFHGNLLFKCMPPDEIIAYGAALLGGILSRGRNVVIRDVTPLSFALRTQVTDMPSIPSTHELFSLYSTSDIENATNNFNASLKIAEGGYGYIYKGMLGDVEVAIKVPKSEGQQGLKEFKREIDALSNIRHPNMVTLVGACYESQALIYGYLHGGSLEDRIKCKGGSLPLSWQTRIKIGTELCSVLVFLHSNSPSIIHGDLKPANILLDENMVCKLSDFGICHLMSRAEKYSKTQNSGSFTDIKGTFSYMDPEFLTTGKLCKRSDVYAVGVILLQLLTGKEPKWIAHLVQVALDNGDFKSILDPLAGEWPSMHAEELARVALSCCQMKKNDRLNLVEVWRFLKVILASCIGLSSYQRVSDDAPPTYFICPIFLEIMEDPHIAADGFTYEKQAIVSWLAFGRDSSPMTNEPLKYTDIVPNRALHLAIQEWLQRNGTA